jgi:hypothetical protein
MWTLLAASAGWAEPLLLVHDAHGALLRQAPVVLRPGGRVLVARTALYGASSALLFDDNRATHRVLAVTAEDRDSGVVELNVGLQAPAGVPLASQPVVLGRGDGHDTQAGEYREVGGYGAIARLQCKNSGVERDAPLYNQHGFLAGWHAVRTVDGRSLAFAIPWERLQAGLQPLPRPLDVAAWDQARNAAADEIYTRALACLWTSDYDGAAFYFRQAAEREPLNARVWFHLAFMEGKTGHTRAKLACFRKAIELVPGFAEAHYHLGIALAMNRDGAGAIAEARALATIDPALGRRLEDFLQIQHSDVLPPPQPKTK